MRTVGVLSDTHGLLRPEALAALEGVDLVLHAGDVGDLRILDDLRRLGPVHAVHGNTDHGAVRASLPRTAVVDLGRPDGSVVAGTPVGPLAFLHHGDRELDLDPRAAGLAVVVRGHTHEPLRLSRGGVLYLNPGSAGPRRFKLPVTVARLRVGPGGDLDAAIVELDVG